MREGGIGKKTHQVFSPQCAGLPVRSSYCWCNEFKIHTLDSFWESTTAKDTGVLSECLKTTGLHWLLFLSPTWSHWRFQLRCRCSSVCAYQDLKLHWWPHTWPFRTSSFLGSQASCTCNIIFIDFLKCNDKKLIIPRMVRDTSVFSVFLVL